MSASYKLRQSKERKKLNQTAKFYHVPLTMARKNEPSNSQGKFFQDSEKKKEEAVLRNQKIKRLYLENKKCERAINCTNRKSGKN